MMPIFERPTARLELGQELLVVHHGATFGDFFLSSSRISVRSCSVGVGPGGGATGAEARLRRFINLTTRNMQKATMIKSTMLLIKSPQARTGPAFCASASVFAPAALDDKAQNLFFRSASPPEVKNPTTGVMMSVTIEVTIFPNAAPMTTPTARSKIGRA